MTTGAEIERGASPRDATVARRTAELCSSDPQVRAAQRSEEITAAAQRPGLRLSQIVATFMEGYADRPALGQRARELVSEWHHQEGPLRAGDFVSTLAFASADYTTIELACIYLGAISVPLQTGAAPAQHLAIVEETRPRILAASIDSLEAALEIALSSTALERLIVFDYEPGDDRPIPPAPGGTARRGPRDSAPVSGARREVLGRCAAPGIDLASPAPDTGRAALHMRLCAPLRAL